jgi:arabinose-5-phosphate isomerase
MQSDTASALDLARKVLKIEAAAILGLVDRIDGQFEKAVQLLFECRGRVIVTGMGKSGIICRKIAATLTSTGTSAWFLRCRTAARPMSCCGCSNRSAGSARD